MLKRVLITVGGAVLVVAIFAGRDAVSYVRTSVGWVKDTLHGAVPMEFQLQRARQMIKDLTPEVQQHMHLIAKEEVDLQRLASQIADTEARLSKDKDQITQLNKSLTSEKQEFQFAGRKYTTEQVKQDLSNRFQRYKTNDATLAQLRQIHDARGRGLDAARQKLEGILAAKRQLQVEVENLEARNQMVAAAQTVSKYQIDDTRLGRVKELVNDLRSRLDVNEKLVQAEGNYRDEIPLDQAAPDNIAEQIRQYFEKAPEKEAKLAKK